MKLTIEQITQIAKDYVEPHSINFSFEEKEAFINDLVNFGEHLINTLNKGE